MQPGRWRYTIPLRLRSLLRRGRVEAELDEELRDHLERKTEAYMARGLAPADARRAALLDLRGVERTKEECRDARHVSWIEDALQDLRYALGVLRRTPGFTAVAVLTLALGIGANTGVFSIVDAVLLRPLPYPKAPRVVMLFLQDPALGLDRGNYGNADFLALRDAQHHSDAVAAFASPGDGFTLTGGEAPAEIQGSAVSAAFFRVLGVTPRLGRTFLPDEDQPGRPPTVVVSDRFWREHLHGDPAALGRAITLDGTGHTVIGVMPPGFRFGDQDGDQVWPIRPIGTPTQRPPYFLNVIGSLRDGSTPAQAGAEASRIAAGVTARFAGSDAVTAVALPLKEVLVGRSRRALLVILGAVALVLLITVTNVANLQIARSTRRQQEMALRAALGAGRARLVRQLLTEGLLLALLGGALGVAVAHWGLRAVVSLNPGALPRMHEIALNAEVLLYTLGIATGAGLLFGLTPALRLRLGRLAASLGERGRGSPEGRGPRAGRLIGGLIVGEFAVAIVLLIGAGLLIRSFARLQSVNPGYDPGHLLTLRVPLPPAAYPKAGQVTAFYDGLLDDVTSRPGVRAAGITMSLPPNLLELQNPFHVEGQSYEPGKAAQLAEEIPVSRGYFGALGITLIAGRFFDPEDALPGRHVLVINQTMARRYFGGRNPVGRRVQTGAATPTSTWYTIVGVAGDVTYEGLDAAGRPTMYVPYTDDGWSPWFVRSMALVVRSSGDPARMTGAVRRAVARLDGSVPVSDVRTMDELLSGSVAVPRFRTVLLASFALLALVLAAMGIYGMLSYAVARRTHEIGVRVALGAGRGQVLWFIMRQGAGLALAGIAIGTAGALALTRLMTSLLFGIAATDPATFAGVAAILLLVALAACYLPARRAVRVDPMVALRAE